MNSNHKQKPPNDPDLINDIVDKLKKQGIFDKFRKDCLADVDTKPAYLNLKGRVDGFVVRFLTSQKWHSGLNKNQLRETLRKQLSDSNMLSVGIKRIVEQVVNPKVDREFKPKVDQAICEFLGVDPKEREDKLKRRDEWQKKQEREQQEEYEKSRDASFEQEPKYQSPTKIGQDSGYIPSLLDFQIHNVNIGMPPTMGSPPAVHPGPNPPLPQPPPIPGQLPPPPFFDHVAPGAPLPQPPPPAFPPTDFKNFNPSETIMPYLATALGLNVGTGKLPPKIPSEDMTDGVDMTYGVPPTEQQEEHKEEETVETAVIEDEPMGVDNLLNIPIPGTEDKDKRDDGKKTDDQQMSEEVVYDQIVLENGVDTSDASGIKPDVVTEDGQVHQSYTEEQILMAQNTDSQGAEKMYHFAWENLNEDAVSDVTVSSVHTSDLSSYDITDVSDSEQSITDMSAGAADTTFGASDGGSDAELSKSTEEVTAAEEVNSPKKAPSPSPIQQPQPIIKAKPRKLIALAYNYSDSDDDETREERKARIAREKEERYLKRQQRRAELDAKMKEKQEERQRLKVQRKNKAKMLETQEETTVKDEIEEKTAAEETKEKIVKEKTEQKVMADEIEEINDKSLEKDPDWDPTMEENTPKKKQVKDSPKQTSDPESVNEEDGMENRIEIEIHLNDESREEITKQEGIEKKVVVKQEPVDVKSEEQVEEHPEEMVSPKPTPKKQKSKGNKQAKKEQLREIKVMEKRMALRRQRTRNRKYFSDDFTSIFTEKKHLLSNSDGYVEVGGQTVEVETVVTQEDVVEETVYDEQLNVPLTQDVQESAHRTRSKSKRDNEYRSGSPYSDISASSKGSSVEFIKETRLSPNQLVGISTEEEKRERQLREEKAAARERSTDKSTQRYEKSDLYKPCQSRRRVPQSRGQHSDKDDSYKSKRSRGRRYSHRSTSADNPDTTSELEDDGSQSDHSWSSSRSLSRSRERSYDSYSRSQSSRSRSYSRSYSRSRSPSMSPPSSQERPNKRDGHSSQASSIESPSCSRSPGYDSAAGRSLARVSFGEAARRHGRPDVDSVNFGHAAARGGGRGGGAAYWSSNKAQSFQRYNNNRGGNNYQRGYSSTTERVTYQRGGHLSDTSTSFPTERHVRTRDSSFSDRPTGSSWSRQQQNQSWEQKDWPSCGNREWPDDDGRDKGRYPPSKRARVHSPCDYEPGELDDVGSPISSDSDLGVGNPYPSSQSPNFTPPIQHSSPSRYSASPISDDEFPTDCPPIIPTRQMNPGEPDIPVIPTSPQHTPTYSGRNSDHDSRSVSSGISASGSGVGAVSHYSSPAAAAVKDRFRATERSTRSLAAARVFEQLPMTRANRKRSEEDPHVAKRLKR